MTARAVIILPLLLALTVASAGAARTRRAFCRWDRAFRSRCDPQLGRRRLVWSALGNAAQPHRHNARQPSIGGAIAILGGTHQHAPTLLAGFASWLLEPLMLLVNPGARVAAERPIQRLKGRSIADINEFGHDNSQTDLAWQAEHDIASS